MSIKPLNSNGTFHQKPPEREPIPLPEMTRMRLIELQALASGAEMAVQSAAQIAGQARGRFNEELEAIMPLLGVADDERHLWGLDLKRGMLVPGTPVAAPPVPGG